MMRSRKRFRTAALVVLSFIVACAVLTIIGARKAHAGGRYGTAPENGTWWYIGEGRNAATLRDCPAGATFTVSYSSGAYDLWKRFCYRGGAKYFPKRTAAVRL